MRSADGKPPSGEATSQAMRHILATCKKHGVSAGVHCFSAEEANARIEEGWQFIAVTSELKMMLDGASRVLAGLGEARGKGDLAKY
jgi:4-hydroxy-2-oxoheptanedioate aldolase